MLAQLCQPAPGLDQLADVATWQETYLRQHRNIFGHGKYRALAVIGAQDHRVQLRAREDVRQNRLEQRLVNLLSTSQFVPRSDDPRFQELVEFVYQATENTFDHARRDFDGNLITQVRTVAMERHQVGTFAGHVPLHEIAPADGSAQHRYLLALRARAAAFGKDPERLSLLALTVSDGGVGIAAKMFGSTEVYDGDLDEEFDLVSRAMRPDGTTKPASDPGRGVGLVKMMRATHRLGGLLEVRTGRLTLTRTFIDVDGRSSHQEFREVASPAFDFDRTGDGDVLVAGTTVSLLFPAFTLRPNLRAARAQAEARARRAADHGATRKDDVRA
jgi:hypothetical protein